MDGRHAGDLVDDAVVVQRLAVEDQAEAAGARVEGDEQDEGLAQVDRNVRLKSRQLEKKDNLASMESFGKPDQSMRKSFKENLRKLQLVTGANNLSL